MIADGPIGSKAIASLRQVVVADGGTEPTSIGLHHIMEGMGDTGASGGIPQTLHTIEQGIGA